MAPRKKTTATTEPEPIDTSRPVPRIDETHTEFQARLNRYVDERDRRLRDG